MKIAIVVVDARDERRQYDKPQPYFGQAVTALLEGLANIPESEFHVICCVHRPLRCPSKLAGNIYYHCVPVPKWGWMPGAYLGCLRAIRRKLREIRPDVVHGQGTERYCALGAVYSGFPNVVTIHGNMNAIVRLHHSRIGSFHWLAARFEDLALPRAGGIICISDYVKNLVENYGVKTWLLPNAIQSMFFDFPREEQLATERPLMLNVGVISERKRQQQLLHTLLSLREEGLDFSTLFVGTSNPKEAYALRFETMLGEANRKHGGFEHIQKLDDASFCRLFGRASAMIHFSSEESFGLTFAEAVARGLYLFASDVGAVREITKGVERAQVFSPEKWDEMKKALRLWLVEEEFKVARPDKPPWEFCQRYHPNSVAQKHLEIYQQVHKASLEGRSYRSKMAFGKAEL